MRKGWVGTKKLWKNTDEDSERNKNVTKAEILTIRKKSTLDEAQDQQKKRNVHRIQRERIVQTRKKKGC